MTNTFPSYWKIPFVILLAFLLKASAIHAQIEVEPAITSPFEPEKLVTDVLKGDGIIITDVKFHGKDLAVGYFSDGQSSIGINEGLLLTTGFAYSASSNVDRGNTATSGQNESTAVFPELEQLADTTLRDVAYYEISFIPLSDSIEFNYVFASEEYPEFGCDCFNDVFGFFIYGDGFPAEGQNIATVPGTENMPVSIKSIHPVDRDTVNGRECPNQFDACVPVNEHLYVDNTSGTDVNYDGFTTILTARAAVEKCKPYTLKIGIADVLDQVWDSGVFLEANSFSANTFAIQAKTPNLDGTIVEGCANADLVFSIPSPKEEDVVINITKNSQSSAIEGVDYVAFPTSITIPAGETSFTIPIQSMDDNVLEKELDSLGIDLQISDCQTETVWIPIKDKGTLINDLGEDMTICAGDTAQLMATNPDIIPLVLEFFSSTDQANLDIAVIPDDVPMPNNVLPTIMELEVNGVNPGQFVPDLLAEVCINITHNRLNQVDVFLVSPDGVIIELTTDNGSIAANYTNTCFTPNAFTSVTSNAAPYTGQFAPEGDFNALLGTAVNGIWQLIVRDDDNSGSFIGKLHNWRIRFNGEQNITYEWAMADSISCLDCPDPLVFPNETTEYILTATDNYGCTASDNIIVNVLEPLPAPNTTCQEVTESSITISWEPVPAARNYEVNVSNNGWERSNKGDFQHEITNLSEGESVEVEVRANGAGSTCGAAAKMQTCVTTSCLEPTPKVDSTRSVSCTGETNGEIFLSADIEAYFILGTDTSELGQTARFSQLAAQDYQIQVLAANKACGSALQVAIIEPVAPIEIQSILTQPSTCFAPNNSFLKVRTAGGTGEINYQWENGNDPSLVFPNQDSIGGLASGNYSILVTDENGCAERSFLNFSAQPDPLIIDTLLKDETCFEKGDGTAEIITSQNSNNLNFDWSNGATTQKIENLAAGDYSVIVTNEVGCEETRTITIAAANPITLSELSIQPETCAGKKDGEVTILAEGGMGDFSYQWNDSENQTNEMATQLAASAYQVVATDAAGCSEVLEVTIPTLTTLNIIPNTQAISCFEEEDGIIDLAISGGTADYQINWSDTQGTDLTTRNDLAAGNYQVTVVDANNCSAETTFSIADKAPIQLVATQDAASCNAADGAIAIGIIEGNSTYTFVWEDDPNRAGARAENLAKGTYAVTVYDADGCFTTQEVILEEKEGISLQATTTPVLCENESTGTATVVATGGSGDYQYLWDDAAAQESPTARNLPQGDYMILVIDGNGCEKSMSIKVPDNSIPLGMNFTKKDISCFGAADGAIITTLTNQTDNFSYRWSSGEDALDLQNKTAGWYQLTIQDANGCAHIDSIEIIEPEEFFAETMIDPISCPAEGDGQLTILPMGGTPPYQYSLDGNRYSPNNTYSNLLPGNYEPAVRDDNNCYAPLPNFKLLEALPLTIAPLDLKVKVGEPTQITPIILNSSGEVSFTWTGNNLADLSCTDCPNPLLNPTSSQLYKLQVTDEDGCEADTRIRVLVEKNRTIYVPTGFSPNLDGRNDRLTVHGVNGTNILSFKIFDRWGELVFSNDGFAANDEAAGWDGTFKGQPFSTAVFAWIVEVQYEDGVTEVVNGHTTLIR